MIKFTLGGSKPLDEFTFKKGVEYGGFDCPKCSKRQTWRTGIELNDIKAWAGNVFTFWCKNCNLKLVCKSDLIVTWQTEEIEALVAPSGARIG